MTQNDIAIVVNGLEKSYKNLKVLQGIHFTVRKGSIFALLGSNGAGKTTMVKILATLLKPERGTARICGFDVVQQPDQVRNVISLTGQYAAVDNVLTGRENLRMIGRLYHMSDADQKTEELLARFNLLDAANRRVTTYSGGMRRRLDIAMSLMGKPLVIFLDEPTTGLDPQSRIAMWKIIKDLANSGITVFLTTQYLEEADQLADYIAILNQGKIVAEGTAETLKKLLPYGYITLRFYNEKEIQLACNLLYEYNANLHEESQTLTVETDGSIKQITDVLSRLQKANITVAEFTQKQPTLEEAFLTIIGEN